MKYDKFLIQAVAPIRDTLSKIEENSHGVIFATDQENTVIGMATDGDIRRYLLDGGSIEDQTSQCINRNFLWENSSVPRELLLKKLDSSIRIIPLLDDTKQLVGLVTRNQIPEQDEGAVYARARSPVRISFGGGGSDLTHYFTGENTGAVISTTISLYAHATLRLRKDSRIVVRSSDLCDELVADSLESAISCAGQFGLIQSVIKAINPQFGFELFLHSDFPMKSGLGGSAVVAAAILGCFNEFRRDKWDAYEIAEIAYQAERHYLEVAGGWQDQYATVFGGFNFMEFRSDQNIIHPLRIQQDVRLELEESLILCDTNTTHDSGQIHDDQRRQMGADAVRSLVDANVNLCIRMRDCLLRGRLSEFGTYLDEAWQLKRQFSEKISSSSLDRIYTDARSNGALGGKLLGAGGGGFFIFFVPAFERYRLISHLEAAGLRVQPFRFDEEGLQSWTVRESV
jgi:D-glycero-alpha-D-manno-heptose-7-phosphate kinase